MLHGMGVTYSIWQNLIPLLKSDYKLILVELPGHGSSPPPDFQSSYYQNSAALLEKLRRRLQIETWDILGYSLGAWVARAYIHQHPAYVKRAIYLCPALLPPALTYSIKSALKLEQKVPRLGSWLLDGWRLRYLVRVLGFNGQKHAYARIWEDEIRSQPASVIKKLIYDLPTAQPNQFQSSHPIPHLFIWGTQDIVVRRPRRLCQQDIIIHGNHSAPMLAAGEINGAIRQFLSQEHSSP